MNTDSNNYQFTSKSGCLPWILIIGMIAWFYPTYKRTKEIDKKLDNISSQIDKLEMKLKIHPDTTLKPFVSDDK